MADTMAHKPFLKIKTGPDTEDVHYSLLYKAIPEEFKKLAEEKLNETEDSRRRGLQHLKEYISNDFDLNSYTLSDVVTVYIAQMMFLLLYPLTSVAGFVIFGDCSSPSVYILYSLFQLARRYIRFCLKSPWRIASFEVLNENTIARIFFTTIRPLISKKILERIVMHGSNFDVLHQDYHPDMLPEAYGGNLGPLNNDVHKQKLKEFLRTIKMENLNI